MTRRSVAAAALSGGASPKPTGAAAGGNGGSDGGPPSGAPAAGAPRAPITVDGSDIVISGPGDAVRFARAVCDVLVQRNGAAFSDACREAADAAFRAGRGYLVPAFAQDYAERYCGAAGNGCVGRVGGRLGAEGVPQGCLGRAHARAPCASICALHPHLRPAPLSAP